MIEKIEFFQKKNYFPQGIYNALSTSLLRKSCQKSEKFFHFLNLFICLFTFFLTYDLTDHEKFLPKANLDTENVRLTKLPEKKLLKVQNLLISNSQ